MAMITGGAPKRHRIIMGPVWNICIEFKTAVQCAGGGTAAYFMSLRSNVTGARKDMTS